MRASGAGPPQRHALAQIGERRSPARDGDRWIARPTRRPTTTSARERNPRTDWPPPDARTLRVRLEVPVHRTKLLRHRGASVGRGAEAGSGAASAAAGGAVSIVGGPTDLQRPCAAFGTGTGSSYQPGGKRLGSGSAGVAWRVRLNARALPQPDPRGRGRLAGGGACAG